MLQHHLAGVFVEAGRALAADPEMRAEINQGIVVVLRSFIAEQKSGVSSFIADQVKAWDMGQLITLIEINIGKDLQYIRFNGVADRRPGRVSRFIPARSCCACSDDCRGRRRPAACFSRNQALASIMERLFDVLRMIID